jgi:hypothetical protein
VPYPLQPVPELQEYILSNMRTAGDVHEMYEMSLQVEPREREDEKIARYYSSNHFSTVVESLLTIFGILDSSPNLGSCEPHARWATERFFHRI